MKHDVKMITLNKGSKLLVINVPNAATMYFESTMIGGKRNVPLNKYDIPHILEHVLSLGNKMFPTGSKFSYEVEKRGTYRNALSSDIFNTYYFTTSKKELKNIIKIATAQIPKPILRNKDVESEIKVIESELSRYIEDDSRRCMEGNKELIISNFTTNERRVRSLKNITHSDIVDFYKKFHNCRNTYFIVAGDIDKKLLTQIKEKLNNELQGYPIGKKEKIIIPKLKDYRRKIASFDTKNTKQSLFKLSFVSPHDNDKWKHILYIIFGIYNGGSFSKVYQKSRKKGLSYGVNAGFYSDVNYSISAIQSKTEPKKILKLFEVCLQELSDICNNKYTDEELSRAKEFEIGILKMRFENTTKFVSWYKTKFIIKEEITSSPDQIIKDIRSVTREDIRKVCKQYFRKDSWALSLVGQNIDKKEYRKLLDKYLK